MLKNCHLVGKVFIHNFQFSGSLPTRWQIAKSHLLIILSGLVRLYLRGCHPTSPFFSIMGWMGKASQMFATAMTMEMRNSTFCIFDKTSVNSCKYGVFIQVFMSIGGIWISRIWIELDWISNQMKFHAHVSCLGKVSCKVSRNSNSPDWKK